jgi:hypothetical protein
MMVLASLYDYAIPLQVSKDMFWNPMYLWDTLKGPKGGNACALNIPCHKEYPFDNLD